MSKHTVTERRLNKQLRKSRQARGKSQLELAKELGVSKATISKWERGTVEPTGRNEIRIKRWIRRGETGTLPRPIHWDSLKPCVKHKDELWKPRRVTLEIEDFGRADITVETKQQYDLMHQMLKNAEEYDDIQ